MKHITKLNQFKITENLYQKLELVLGDELSKSKKHKAYYLFTVLFSEGWWVEDNVDKVRKAVRDHTLNLIWERRDPNERDDDNIIIYFLEKENGKYFIVLVHDRVHNHEGPGLLDMIPVKRNDFGMTCIYPRPRPSRRKLKTNRNKNLISQKS
jgi:hypothetical protein